MVALAGGNNIKCAEYATFGTKELSQNILNALEERKACLMSNHGRLHLANLLTKHLNLLKRLKIFVINT